VKRAVESIWAQYGKIEVFLLKNGLYLFRFEDEKTRDEVMEAKVWHMANKPLILRKWTPGMQLLKLSLSSIPIWIKLHNLPIEFWNTTCLSYVASGVGKLICADSVTKVQLRLGFARVLVEVNIDSNFPKEVEIVGANGIRVVVGVEYPWILIKCKKCKSFGHLAHTCTKIEKQVWIPKRNVPVFPNHNGYGTKKGSEVNMETIPSMVDKEQWKVVKSARKTPVTKPAVMDSQRHWTNSFHLLARADGRYESGEERGLGPKSQSLQQVIEYALNEESANVLKDKGKGKMEEDEEILMKFFSYYMNFLIWNVRGSNHPSKQKEVRNMINLHKIGQICLIETRVKESKADEIRSFIVSNWDYAFNYDKHFLGRIWICWKKI
jgi:hypothetical protein